MQVLIMRYLCMAAVAALAVLSQPAAAAPADFSMLAGMLDHGPPIAGATEAKGLLERGESLSDSGASEQALPVFDQLVSKYGSFTDTDTRVLVSRAMIDKGLALIEVGQVHNADTTFDAIVASFGDAGDLQLQRAVAIALFLKGSLFVEHSSERATVPFGQLISKFGAATDPTLLQFVARARLGVAQALAADSELDRATQARDAESKTNQTVAAYDDVVARYGTASDGVLRAQATLALFGKAKIYSLDQAKLLAALDKVVERYGNDSDDPVQNAVAQSLIFKADMLRKLGSEQQALATYDEVVSRFGQSANLQVAFEVATAMFDKAVALHFDGNHTTAIATYDALISRFSSEHERDFDILVAKSLVNRGAALRRLGKIAAAIAAWDEVDRRFGNSPAWSLKGQAAMALINKGVALDSTGSRAEALATYRMIPKRFGEASADTQASVPNAMTASLVAEDARRRSSAKSRFELESYEINNLDPREICLPSKIEVSCMETAASNNPEHKQTQFFLATTYIRAKKKEETLAQVIRLRKMGGPDAGMVLSLAYEFWPDWLKDPRFREEFKRADEVAAEPGVTR